MSKKEIARRMNRSYSSIKREIKRNGYYNWHGHYLIDRKSRMIQIKGISSKKKDLVRETIKRIVSMKGGKKYNNR